MGLAHMLAANDSPETTWAILQMVYEGVTKIALSALRVAAAILSEFLSYWKLSRPLKLPILGFQNLLLRFLAYYQNN